MAHFITDEDRKEIHADWWADDETVTIKLFTYVDKQKRTDRAVVGPVLKDDAGNMRIKIDSGLHAEATLVLGIVAWTFRDKDGEEIPCDSEHKCALNPRDGLYIYEEIEAYNEERTAEAQESF